jgi:hypothetical protein
MNATASARLRVDTRVKPDGGLSQSKSDYPTSTNCRNRQAEFGAHWG